MHGIAMGRRARAAWAWLVGAAAFLVYAATLAGAHTFDASAFGLAIHDRAFLPSVFRPHHVLFLPAAIALHRGATALGLPATAFTTGQLFAAVWGGVAAGLLFALTLRFLRPLHALFVTALLITMHGTWSMATEVEVYTSSLSAVLAVYLALAVRRPRWWLCGLLWGCAVLAHLSNVLLAVPLAVYAGLAVRPGRRIAALAAAAFTGAAVALAVHLAVAVACVGVRTPRHYLDWLLPNYLYSQRYGVMSMERLRCSVAGFHSAFVARPEAAWTIPHLLAFCLAAAGACRILPRHRRWTLPLAAHFAVYAVFFTWWDAGNIEMLVVTMLPIVVLASVALVACPSRLYRLVLLAALVSQVAANVPRMIERRDPALDRPREEAARIAAYTRPFDLVITFRDQLPALSRTLLNRQNVVTLADYTGRECDFERALRAMERRAAYVRGFGGRTYLTVGGRNPHPLDLAALRVTHEQYLAGLRRACGTDFETTAARGLLFR